MSCPFKGQFDWNACEEKRVAISDLKEESFQERIWSLKFNFYVLNSLLLTLTHTWGQIPLYRCEPYSHTSCLQKIAFGCCNHEISQAFNYWAVYSIFQLLCVLIYINVHPPRYLSIFSFTLQCLGLFFAKICMLFTGWEVRIVNLRPSAWVVSCHLREDIHCQIKQV